MRGRAARLALERARRGAAPLARHVAAVNIRGARALLRALAFAGERHAGTARLGKTDGDRLLGGTGAVLAFADVVELLADEFAGDGACRLTFARFAPRALEGAFFGHGASFRKVGAAHPSPLPAP